MPPPTQSAIWSYFELNNENSAKCIICKKKYSRKGRITTPLKNHLKSKHPQEYKTFLSKDIHRKLKDITEKNMTPLQEAQNQSLMTEALQADQRRDNDNVMYIDKLIGEMIALQNLPFHFIEGIGFHRLMQGICPNYNLKGQKYYLNFVTKDIYNKVAFKVKELIQKFDCMSFTSDISVDPSSNASLLTIACHGISKDFHRASFILECETFDDNLTVNLIPNKFETMLIEWNISKERIHCITRGLNMNRYMQVLGLNYIPCTVKKLQDAISISLNTQKNVQDVKQKCEKISSHFNHSTNAQQKLNQIQDRLMQPHVRIFQDWASLFHMCDQLLKAKDGLCLYFNENDVKPLLQDDWEIIENCVELLRPFAQAIQELSNSQNLISSVIPITQILIKKLDDYLSKSDDNGIMQVDATGLKNEISSKFSDLDNNFLFMIATYLDPRYKHKFFKPFSEAVIISEIIKMKQIHEDTSDYLGCVNHKKRISNYLNPVDDQQPTTSNAAAVKLNLKSELAMMLDSSSEEENEHNNDSTDILKKELQRYRKEKRINIEENPLSWWSRHYETYKFLAPIARKYLSPASASIFSDRIFSAAKLINEPIQNKLDPKTAAILLFIKNNLPTLNFDY